MARFEFKWDGAEVALRAERAAGRAIIAVGENIAADTKRITHKISGTLARSVHTGPADYDGADDEARARSADIENTREATPTPLGPTIAVGSWLPYACVEWIGRGHPGITQGVEMSRGERAHMIFTQAYREEGIAGD